MTLPSLFAASTLALTAFAHAAVAQSATAATPSAPGTLTHIPALTVPAQTLAYAETSHSSPRHTLSLADGTKAQVAMNKPVLSSKPCYAMRSYNYTASADAPQLTGSTTCTVAGPNSALRADLPATR